MFVSLGDSGGGEQGLSAELRPALAAGYAVVGARRLPSTSSTHRANFSGSFHKLLLLPMCTAKRVRASDHGGSSVYILWSCGAGCGEPGKIRSAMDRAFGHSFAIFALSLRTLRSKVLELLTAKDAEETRGARGKPLDLGPILAGGAAFQGGRCRIRHLARISTVDIRRAQALNSWRRVSRSVQVNPRNRQSAETRRDPPGATMNKADLIDRIAMGAGISKTQAASAIDTSVESITSALKKGDRVALIGFGTFSISQRKARNGRNPQTGATIKIPARRVAKFSAGAELRKAVNRGK